MTLTDNKQLFNTSVTKYTYNLHARERSNYLQSQFCPSDEWSEHMCFPLLLFSAKARGSQIYQLKHFQSNAHRSSNV